MVSKNLEASVQERRKSRRKSLSKISYSDEVRPSCQLLPPRTNKKKILGKVNLVNVDVEKILSTMEGLKSSSSHERLFSLCEKYLHLFSGLRFNISRMAPTGYRLYLHSSRLPEFANKKLVQWNDLPHSQKEKFLKRASQLSELHSIICETLQIESQFVEETNAKKATKMTSKKPAKRVGRPATKKKDADEEWQPRERSPSQPRRELDQPDRINDLRLRSRILQKPKRPLRLRPIETSFSGTDCSSSLLSSSGSFDAIDYDLDFAYEPSTPNSSWADKGGQASADLSGIWISPNVTNDKFESLIPWRVPDGSKKTNFEPQKTTDTAPLLHGVASENQDQPTSAPSDETDTCSEEEGIPRPPKLRNNFMPTEIQSLELGYLIFDLGLSEKQLEEIAVCQINLELQKPYSQAHDFSPYLTENDGYAMNLESDVEMRDVSLQWFNTRTEGGGYPIQMSVNVETKTQGTQTDIVGEIVPKANVKEMQSQESQTHSSDSSDDDDDHDMNHDGPRVTNIPVIKLGCAKTINWNAKAGICDKLTGSNSKKLDALVKEGDDGAVIVLSICADDVDVNNKDSGFSSSTSSISLDNFSNRGGSLSSGIHSQSSFSEEILDLNCSEEMLESSTVSGEIASGFGHKSVNQISTQKNQIESLSVPTDATQGITKNMCLESQVLSASANPSSLGIGEGCDDLLSVDDMIDEILGSNDPLQYIPY